MQTTRSFVGMDVHKATISLSVVEDGRNGPVRFLGVIPNPAGRHREDGQASCEARRAQLRNEAGFRVDVMWLMIKDDEYIVIIRRILVTVPASHPAIAFSMSTTPIAPKSMLW